ncbi:MAG: response regulator [Cellulosilyticaceae bacterium]
MHFNTVIADDEYFIRQRLKKIIPWNELNLTLVGEAENGLQVINLLMTHTVDLLILDIQMPGMTGVEVAQYIYNKGLKTKIIILSGYSDFEYAQKTIRLGVLDYLLKPIAPASLNQALSDCIHKISSFNQEAIDLKKYYHYKKQVHLNQFLLGTISLDHLYTHYPHLKLFPFCAFISFFINDSSSQLMDRIKAILEDNKMTSEYFKESESTYSLQIFFKSTAEHEKLKEILVPLLTSFDNYTFAVIGELFYIERKWLPYHKKTLQALNNRYFSKDSYIQYLQPPNLSLEYHKSLSKIRQKLTAFINSKDEEAFISYIEECFTDIIQKSDCQYLQTILYEILLTYTIYYPQMIDLEITINEFVSNLLDEDYVLEHLKTLLISYGMRCLSKSETLPSDIIVSQKIIKYIEAHYTELDLSVSKIADFFDFNTSYIGTLFKKVNNQSLLHYITTVRLDASKHLLDSQKYKVSEIAEMVGYSDVFYYSKRFKKMYGYSPKEYTLVKMSSH